MKTYFFILLFIFLGSRCWSQKQTVYKSYTGTSLNDTSYVRVLDGLIIKNDDFIEDFNSVKYIRSKETLIEYGFDAKKFLMIIESKDRTSIEKLIDSSLYSSADFIKSFKLPLEYILPIAINGKLLGIEEKGKTLKRIEFKKIVAITYINTQEAMLKYLITPFGVINLKIKEENN